MKLTTFLVSAVLALGVAAVDPEAGNDVEVRDFSGESLNELDARDEEEFDVRDEQDLEARGGYPKCKGSNVEWKKVDYDWKCVCTRSGEYYDKYKGCVCKKGYEYSEEYSKCIPKCYGYEKYNPKTGKCEKPFYCKGKNVEIVDDYGVKSCKCTREGEKYSEKYGCKCDDGYVFSDKYHKCIPVCKDYEKYNPKTGKCEKPFYCKGKNVEIIVDNYGQKSCKCTREGEKYSEKYGCKCDDGYVFSDKYHKCIPVCKDYEKYNPKTGKCEKPFYCKGKNVEIVVDNYGEKSCKCLREGEVYSPKYGCQCKEGYEFSDKYHKCIPVCKDYEEYNPKTDKCEKPFHCKGKNVEIVVDNYGQKSCKCLLEGQVYNKWRGCQCKDGEYFSKEYKKCIPKCSYGTEYNGHECAPICKGDYVTYKHDKCKCLKPGYYYDESSGCKPRCPAGTTYDWHKKECKCDTYGQVYDKDHKKCYTPCKGKYVELKWDNYEPTCVCTKDGYEYTKWGCKPVCKAPATLEYGKCKCPGDQKYDQHKGCYCPWGKKYDSEHERCYKPCGKNEKLIWDYGQPKCVCKDGYVPTKWGCQKKKHGGGYY